MLKTRYLRRIRIKRITGKENWIKWKNKIGVIMIRKIPQLAKYEILHEQLHVRFRNMSYKYRRNYITNILEDYIINRGMKVSIKMRVKKILSNSIKSGVFSIKDVENVMLYTTQTTKKMLLLLKPKTCRRLLLTNTTATKIAIQAIYEVMCEELLRVINVLMEEALGQK